MSKYRVLEENRAGDITYVLERKVMWVFWIEDSTWNSLDLARARLGVLLKKDAKTKRKVIEEV